MTTTDTLLGGKVRLTQPRHGYRAGLDAVLAAASVPAKPGDHVLDAGCGAGAISLCLLQRLPNLQLYGIESDPAMADLARQNAIDNDRGEHFHVIGGSITEKLPDLPLQFDHIVTNPPYGDPGNTLPPNDYKARACHETDVDLKTWLKFCASRLKSKACLTIIHRADRLDDIIAFLHKGFGDITVFPLWSFAGEPAKRIIVRARKTMRSPARMLPGLVMHQQNREWTDQAKAVLQDGTALF